MLKSIIQQFFTGTWFLMLLQTSLATPSQDTIVDTPSTYPIESLSDRPSFSEAGFEEPTSAYPSLSPLSADGTIFDIIGSEDDLTVVDSLIRLSEISESLIFPPFTIFAPINDGFETLSQKFPFLPYYLEPEYIVHLQDILWLHVTTPTYLEANLTDGTVLTMASFDDVDVGVTSRDINLYYALSNTTIVESDLIASDGVVHKVNNVLEPNFLSESLLDVVNRNQADDSLGVLLSLIELVPSVADLLATGENYTLFAPYDTAFSYLSNDTITYLTDPANIDALTDILNYHIIPQVLPMQVIVNGPYETVQGSTVEIDLDPDFIYFSVNNADVTRFNRLASTGIMYVINNVLIPPTGTEEPTGPLTEPPARSPRAAPVAAPSRA